MNILKLSWWEKVLVGGVLSFLQTLLASAKNPAEITALEFVTQFLQELLNGTVASDPLPVGAVFKAAPEEAAAPTVSLNWWERLLINGVVAFLEEWIASAGIKNEYALQAIDFVIAFLQALLGGAVDPAPVPMP